MRKLNFINHEYYHIYNRGVDKRDIFLEEDDYLRFLKNIKDFNNDSKHAQRVYIKNRGRGGKTELSSEASELSSVTTPKDLDTFFKSLPKLVEIVCYCLNPNHFHLLIKQLVDAGLEKFMHKLGSGYTNFFNIKYKRNGSLFQCPFKAAQIKSFEHLVWLSVYVNTNAQIHDIIDDAVNYAWCSYPYYMGIKENDFCNKKIILDKVKDYKKIAEDTTSFMKKKKEMEKYLIEVFKE